MFFTVRYGLLMVKYPIDKTMGCGENKRTTAAWRISAPQRPAETLVAFEEC